MSTTIEAKVYRAVRETSYFEQGEWIVSAREMFGPAFELVQTRLVSRSMFPLLGIVESGAFLPFPSLEQAEESMGKFSV